MDQEVLRFGRNQHGMVDPGGLAQAPEQLVMGVVGQVHIKKNPVGRWQVLQRSAGLRRRIGALYFGTGLGGTQQCGQPLASEWMVVNNQDIHGSLSSLRRSSSVPSVNASTLAFTGLD